MKTLHAACSAELNDGLESDLAECLHYERERDYLPYLPHYLLCSYSFLPLIMKGVPAVSVRTLSVVDVGMQFS